MNPVLDVIVPDRETQSRGVILALELCGVTAAVTALSDEECAVAFFWTRSRAPQCRAIALAFAKAYAAEEPRRGVGVGCEWIDFRVEGNEAHACRCALSFVNGSLGMAA